MTVEINGPKINAAVVTDRVISIRVLRSASELETIREFWESSTGNRDSDFDSFTTFLKENSSTLRPHVVVADCSGIVVAIFVGRIDKGFVTCRLGYLKLKLPATILCFVYGGLRGDDSPEICGAIVESVVNSLSEGDADLAYLNYIKKDSLFYNAAMRHSRLLTRDYVLLSQHHYVAELPKSSASFYQELSPKVRKNQKWQAKRLLTQFNGDVVVKQFRSENEVDALVTEVETVARKSYQRGLGVGFVDNVLTREHMRLKARRNWLRAFVLYLGGQPAAFWIGDKNQNTFGSDYIGYDPQYSTYSPGMYLVLKVIEQFCDDPAEGVNQIDFGTGHAQYKEVLSNQGFVETSIHFFSPSGKGVYLNVVRSAIMRLDRSVKSVLARTRMLKKIKKAWRQRAIPKNEKRAEV